MEFLALLYFIWILWALGFSLEYLIARLKWFKKNLFSKDPIIEKFVMRFGLGMAGMPVLLMILHQIRLPVLWWWVVLILVSIIPIFSLINAIRKKIKIDLMSLIPKKIDVAFILVVLFFIFHCVTMFTGAFTIPYLEDGDPYEHAAGAKMIAETGVGWISGMSLHHYLEPYPPFYDTFLGVLHQVHPESINWTLKFFNALFVSLSTLFAYFFFKRLTKHNWIGVLGALAITALPSFSSHFIFAQSYAMTIIFVALYCAVRLRDDKRWFIPLAITTASMTVVQPSTALVTTFLLGLYFLGVFLSRLAPVKKMIKDKVLLRLFFALLIGGILGFVIFWGPLMVIYSGGSIESGLWMGGENRKFLNFVDDYEVIYPKFQHFWYAPHMANTPPHSNKIDNPKGLGPYICITVFIGLLLSIGLLALSFFKKFKKKIFFEREVLIIALLWFFYGLYGVLGDYFPIRVLPNRFWATFGIGVALLCAIALFSILKISWSIKPKKGLFRTISVIVVIILLAGIIFVSAAKKYEVNTANWPQHKFRGNPYDPFDPNTELGVYLAIMNTFPKNTKIADACTDKEAILASDMIYESWNKELIMYEQPYSDTSRWGWNKHQMTENREKYGALWTNYYADTPNGLWSTLKKHGYEYLLFSFRCAELYGDNETNNRLAELVSSGLFVPVPPSNQAVIVMKLK